MEHAVTVEPTQPAEAAVIWLHGLGASGHDFEPAVPLLGLDDQPIRFIFPHAPERPVTVNGGITMPAWYDIEHMDIERTIDVSGIQESANRVDHIIAAQMDAGIPAQRICLVGFSQGGAVALYAGVRSSQPLAGILALSTYWVGAQDPTLTPGRNPSDVSIEIHHGTTDPVVPYALGEHALEALKALGYPVTFQAFDMPHSVVPEQLRVIGTWITRHFTVESPTRSKE
jgi:phospholipase/carboxylesterase